VKDVAGNGVVGGDGGKPDIVVVDNTLREGDQTPGVAFSVEQKLEILSLLVSAGVTVFDAALPESSGSEVEFLKEASRRFPSIRLGASCRMIRSALEHAVAAGANELYAIVPVSDLHLFRRLKISREDLLRGIDEQLSGIASSATLNIALEDSLNADPGFLRTAVERCADVGASRVFVADTLGSALPERVAAVTRAVRAALPPGVAVGCHFHNDFGLALANALAAIGAGATFPTAGVNGLGERAGNTDLAQLVAALRLLLHVDCPVRLDRVRDLSWRVCRMTGVLVSQNAPVTGFNAFRHTSGIHVDGMLKDRSTYGAIDPADFGQKEQLVLGKHSGRAHIAHLLKEEVHDDPELMAELVARVKRLAEQRAGSREAAALADAFEAFNRQSLGLALEDLLRSIDEENGNGGL
jgi:isopropylmalate/homocitrate/citramalate synthase